MTTTTMILGLLAVASALLGAAPTLAQQITGVPGAPAALAHPDASTTVYCGPSKPAGVSDGNGSQTVPGKGWNTLLRLDSPLEPFFTKQWRPSEIEVVH